MHLVLDGKNVTNSNRISHESIENKEINPTDKREYLTLEWNL